MNSSLPQFSPGAFLAPAVDWLNRNLHPLFAAISSLIEAVLVALHSGFDEFKRLGRGLGSGRDMHVPSSRVPDLW